MKQLVLIIIFLNVLVVFSQAQDREQIVNETALFIKALESKDYDYFLDMTYPKIYDYYDRDFFLNEIKNTFEGNNEFTITFLDIENIVFEPSQIFSPEDLKSKYAFVSYQMKLQMSFEYQQFEEDEKEYLVNIMKADDYDVVFINDNTLVMSQPSLIIAINDEVTNFKWKYLNFDKSNPYIYKMLSEEIMEKAKKFHLELILKQQ
jgi:hypothetical protein